MHLFKVVTFTKRGRKTHTPEQQAESAKRAQLKAQLKKPRLDPIEEDDD